MELRRVSANPLAPALSRMAAVLIACAASVAPCGCIESPWDSAAEKRPARTTDACEQRFVVDGARLGTWVDQRPSGSIIRHGMIVVDNPRMISTTEGVGARIEVVSSGPELQGKIAAIVSDRIPVGPNMTANFALGRVVPVRIERVDGAGSRTLLAEGSVAFLELTR